MIWMTEIKLLFRYDSIKSNKIFQREESRNTNCNSLLMNVNVRFCFFILFFFQKVKHTECFDSSFLVGVFWIVFQWLGPWLGEDKSKADVQKEEEKPCASGRRLPPLRIEYCPLVCLQAVGNSGQITQRNFHTWSDLLPSDLSTYFEILEVWL